MAKREGLDKVLKPLSNLKDIAEERKAFRKEQKKASEQLNKDRASLKSLVEEWAEAENEGDKIVANALDAQIKTTQESIEVQKANIAVADAIQESKETGEELDLNGVEKVLMKFMGTPGDNKVFREKLIKGISSIPDAVKGFGSAAVDKGKGILGAFFDALKAGVMLVGGLVALQGFIEGIGKVNKFFEGQDGIGMVESFASGIAGIVQAFTGMSDEDAGKIAQQVATGLNFVVDGLKAVVMAFGRLTGLKDRTDEAEQGFMAVAKDIAIAFGAILFIFSGTLMPLLGSIAAVALPPLVGAFMALSSFLIFTLLPAIGALLLPFAPFIIGIGLIIAAIAFAADQVGGIGNLMELTIAKLKDGFVNFINSIANFINGLIEMIPYPFTPDFRVPLMEGGNSAEAVRARIDQELASEAASSVEENAVASADAERAAQFQMPDMGNFLNNQTVTTNNTTQFNMPQMPQTDAGQTAKLFGLE